MNRAIRTLAFCSNLTGLEVSRLRDSSKNRFGQRRVHSLYAIYGLCDMEVHRSACKHIGVIPRQAALGCQVVNHFLRGTARGFVQAFMKPHSNDVGGSFCTRPAEFLIFPYCETEYSGQVSLECRDAHFTVTLGCVSIAD